MFSVKGQTVPICQRESQTTLPEEHRKNDETLYQSVYGHRCSVNLRIRGMHITYCFCDFLFYGNPCMKVENVML